MHVGVFSITIGKKTPTDKYSKKEHCENRKNQDEFEKEEFATKCSWLLIERWMYTCKMQIRQQNTNSVCDRSQEFEFWIKQLPTMTSLKFCIRIVT